MVFCYNNLNGQNWFMDFVLTGEKSRELFLVSENICLLGLYLKIFFHLFGC